MRTCTLVSICCLTLAIAGCVPPTRAPPPPPVATPAPESTRARFSVEATSNDAWNAVGQILVRSPGVEYEGRAQMLGLYAIRYRGERLRVLTRALPLSESIRRTTTEVAVTGVGDTPVDGAAVIDLMLVLQRELPAEIASVRAKFAAQKRAQERGKKTKARKKPGRK